MIILSIASGLQPARGDAMAYVPDAAAIEEAAHVPVTVTFLHCCSHHHHNTIPPLGTYLLTYFYLYVFTCV